MGEVVEFKRAAKSSDHNQDILLRTVIGVPAQTVDLDAMTPEERAKFLEDCPYPTAG